MCYGYKLDQALKFQWNRYENREASKHYSMSFWIYVLKELFLKQEQNKTASLLNLISIIEVNIFNGGDESRKLSRTARLLIGIDRKDHDILSKLFDDENIDKTISDYNQLLDDDETEDQFYPYVHHISNQIFDTSSVYHESGTFISPLVHALHNQDIKMVNILRRHPSFCFPSFLKSNELKNLFLDERTHDSVDYIKNIYCTFFYILLKRDENFFNNPDLKDFLSCRTRELSMACFLRFAQLFLDSERGNPNPNTLEQQFIRTAICTKTLLIR